MSCLSPLSIGESGKWRSWGRGERDPGNEVEGRGGHQTEKDKLKKKKLKT